MPRNERAAGPSEGQAGRLLKVCRGPVMTVYVSLPGASGQSRDSTRQFRAGKAGVSGAGEMVTEMGHLGVRLDEEAKGDARR